MNSITYTLEKNGTMNITLPASAVARLVRVAVAVNALEWTQGGATAETIARALVGDQLNALTSGETDALGTAVVDGIVGMIDTDTTDAATDAKRREELASTVESLMRRPIHPALTDAA